jgi:2-polyprenyl-6-methoxyphenol hydroxylase-like FAD-dependent oxidoreductase
LDGDVEFILGDSIVGLDDRGDAVAVSFERADARDFDLVVGADGLHSNVRRLTFGPEEHDDEGFDGAPLARDDFYRVVHSIELTDY